MQAPGFILFHANAASKNVGFIFKKKVDHAWPARLTMHNQWSNLQNFFRHNFIRYYDNTYKDLNHNNFTYNINKCK